MGVENKKVNLEKYSIYIRLVINFCASLRKDATFHMCTTDKINYIKTDSNIQRHT